jgi:hypothetical protein
VATGAAVRYVCAVCGLAVDRSSSGLKCFDVTLRSDSFIGFKNASKDDFDEL